MGDAISKILNYVGTSDEWAAFGKLNAIEKFIEAHHSVLASQLRAELYEVISCPVSNSEDALSVAVEWMEKQSLAAEFQGFCQSMALTSGESITIAAMNASAESAGWTSSETRRVVEAFIAENLTASEWDEYMFQEATHTLASEDPEDYRDIEIEDLIAMADFSDWTIAEYGAGFIDASDKTLGVSRKFQEYLEQFASSPLPEALADSNPQTARSI